MSIHARKEDMMYQATDCLCETLISASIEHTPPHKHTTFIHHHQERQRTNLPSSQKRRLPKKTPKSPVTEILPASSFQLLPGRSDMRIVYLNQKISKSARPPPPTLHGMTKDITYLGSESQTRQCLPQMRLQRTDHTEHKRLAIPSQRELQQICQLAVPVGYVTSVFALAERTDHVAQTAQAAVDVLSLLQTCSLDFTLTETLATGKVYEVECAFASLARDGIVA